MNILGYDINLEIVALCIVMYFIIVFNIFYSTIRLQGFKEVYELIGISVEEGFEVLKQTSKKIKKIKNQKMEETQKQTNASNKK